MTDKKSNTLEAFNLNGSIAVITGGAGFLGERHAEAILDGNGEVVLVDINAKSLDSKVKRLAGDYGKRVHGYTLDITDDNMVRKTIQKIEKEVGPIDILINNAANNPHVKSDGKMNSSRLEDFSVETWDKDIAVGLTGAFLMAKHIGPRMAKRKKGVILNIASELGIIAPDQRLYRKEGLPDDEQPVKPVTYPVVKHGIIGLTKYLATYWIGKGIRSNAVAFGGVFRDQPQDFLEKLNKLSPLGRMADKNEYKGVVLFLCSEASSFMTGATVQIDGGRTCW